MFAQRKKSGGVRSGDCGGQSPFEITLLPKKGLSFCRVSHFLPVCDTLLHPAGRSKLPLTHVNHPVAINYTYVKICRVFFLDCFILARVLQNIWGLLELNYSVFFVFVLLLLLWVA